MNIKQSPIFYKGNKYKWLVQCWKLIPKNIDTFYDIFGGSGTMTINFLNTANQVVYNEFNERVFKFFNYFLNTDPKIANDQVQKYIEKYDLWQNLEIEKNRTNAHLYQEAYDKFYIARERAITNGDHKLVEFWNFWQNYTFCNNINFYDPRDEKLIFESFGSRSYNSELAIKKHYGIYGKKNVVTTNKSFTDFIDQEFKKDDFVYLDPPYFNTNADYNKNWTWELEQKFLEFVEVLIKKGIRFMVSNVLQHKGKVNSHLRDFIAKHNLNTFYPKIEYTNGGNGVNDRETNDTVEVVIMNYDPVEEGDLTEQLSLF